MWITNGESSENIVPIIALYYWQLKLFDKVVGLQGYVY